MVRAVLVALTVLAATPLAAFTPVGAERSVNDASVSCPQIDRLALYIAYATDYEQLEICPPVIFGANDPLRGRRMMDRGTARLRGTTYYTDTGTIQLSASTDLSSIVGQAALLHELVHAYQFAHEAHLNAPCLAALEMEAHTVQARFLRENGYEEEALEVEQRAARRSTCTAWADATR